MFLQRLTLILAVLFASWSSADDELPSSPPIRGLVPVYLLEVPEGLDTVLVADAASAGLLRFGNAADGLAYRDQHYLSVGLRGVGKQRQGDQRTPLGVYFLTEELDTTRLDPKYGAAAFVMDYPNAWDRLQNRTGHGIWLHGVHPATPLRPPLDTDGCLALPNEQLLGLKAALSMHTTPVIVTRRIEWANPDDVAAEREGLRAAMDAWRQAIADRDIHAYLALYDESFHARGMDKREWARFRIASFAAAEPADIALSDMLLVRDPEESDLYLARFRQTTRQQKTAISVWKRLYWRKGSDGFRVVTEDAG